jgi:hypothetical protein
MSSVEEERFIERRQPSAKVRIELNDEERRRIATELGLTEREMDAVPSYVDIARFDVQESVDEVSGFMFQAYANPRATADQVGVIGAFRPENPAAKIPPWILIAV